MAGDTDAEHGSGGDRNRPGWLLIETFGWPKDPPTIVNWGGRPREFTPLDKPLRNAASRVRRAIETVAASREPLSVRSGGHRVEVVPHFVDKRLHGVQYWAGRESDPVPPRPTAGCWWIDLTDLTALGSPEWAEMADIPPEYRGQSRSVAAMFAQVATDVNESQAIKTIVVARPGTTHQGIWTVARRDGTKWRSHFSCRVFAQPGAHGEPEHRVVRGISQEVAAFPHGEPGPIVLLEHKLLESITRPGEYRALFNLQNLRLIRWVHGSEVPERIAWQGVEGEAEPAVHPDDRRTMIAMAKGLDKSSTSGTLRVRGTDGGWIRIAITANLVAIERDVTAGLATFTIVDEQH